MPFCLMIPIACPNCSWRVSKLTGDCLCPGIDYETKSENGHMYMRIPPLKCPGCGEDTIYDVSNNERLGIEWSDDQRKQAQGLFQWKRMEG